MTILVLSSKAAHSDCITFGKDLNLTNSNFSSYRDNLQLYCDPIDVL